MCPVEQYTIIHNLSPKKNQKEYSIFFYKTHFMHLFSADAWVFKKKIKKFDPENMKKLFFSRAAQILKFECTT